ncbi:MAG: hypothetical protein ABL869_01195 [Candidatus Nitrotoga sp.]
MLEEIDRRRLRGKVLVWLDDNLGAEHLWEYLTPKQIAFMAEFEGHSRVGCFKGFDPTSFAFNTAAPAELFDQQFIVFDRLLRAGFDLYAYATFTSPPGHCTKQRMSAFVDRLQAIDPLLPLRTIPLAIRPFSATKHRMDRQHECSIDEQSLAGDLWDDELRVRFSTAELDLPYESINIRRPPYPISEC